jgi:hypothetical protein
MRDFAEKRLREWDSFFRSHREMSYAAPNKIQSVDAQAQKTELKRRTRGD